MLCRCFNNVTNNSFTVKPNRSEYVVNYQISYSAYSTAESSNKLYCVEFKYEHSRKDRTAEVLKLC